MADDFTERYRDLLTGWYDCVDRIVLNAYYPMGSTAGGFRTWWRHMIGGSDAEADAGAACSSSEPSCVARSTCCYTRHRPRRITAG